MIRTKKNYVVVLTMIILSLTIGTGYFGKVKASSYKPVIEYTIPGTGAQVMMPNGVGAYWQAGIAKIRINNPGNDLAFCIEPTVIGFDGIYTQLSDINDQLRYQMELIKYYGYDLTGKSDDDYATVQYMIWELLGANITFYDHFGSRYPGLKANVQNQIDAHNVLPSFHGSNHSIVMDDTLVLTDTTGVLNKFYVVDNGGADVSINGNQLVIKPSLNTPDLSKIKLQKVKQEHQGSTLVYRSPGNGAQDVTVLSVGDPLTTWLDIETIKFGSVEILKKDNLGTHVPGVSFIISRSHDMSNPEGPFTTGASGKVKIDNLAPGDLYIQEVSVVPPLVLNSTIHKVSVSPNQTYEFTQINDRVLGQVVLKKQDKLTGELSQGDAKLYPATYGLFARDHIIDPISGRTLHLPEDLISTQTTSTTSLKLVWSNLHLGKYYIKETKAPLGYSLDTKEYEINLGYMNDSTPVVEVDVVSNESVFEGDFDLRKVIGENQNGVQKFEKGAEFIVQLESDIQSLGENNAYIYDTLLTDDDGYAKSSKLPYGKYRVTQTKVGDSSLAFAPPFHIEILNENQETTHLVVNNKKYTAMLKIEKYLTNTNEVITVNGATFKIWDYSTDDYYTEIIGKETIDEWVTDSEGSVFSNLSMKAGKYAVCEIKAPSGTNLNEECLDFEIKQSNTHEVDEHFRPIQIVRFGNTAPHGKIKIYKNYENLIDTEKLAGFELFVGGNEIVSPASGEVIYKKGEKVVNPRNEDGLWYEKDGELIINDLPLGLGNATYYLKEKVTSDAYEIDPRTFEFNFVQGDENILEYEKELKLENKLKKTDLSIVKIDSYSREVLKGYEGFEFTLYRDDNLSEVYATAEVDVETGIASFEDIIYGEKLYLKETATHPDFYLSEDTIEIAFDNTLSSVGKKYEIEFENQPIPEFDTIATGETNGKLIDPTMNNKVYDSITYTNVDLSKEYRLVTRLLDYKTGEIVGESLIEPLTFVEKDGVFKSVVDVKANTLENDRYYFSQHMYEISDKSDEEDKLLIDHNDAEDLAQTVKAKEKDFLMEIKKVDEKSKKVIKEKEFKFQLKAYKEGELIDEQVLDSNTENGTVSYKFTGEGKYDEIKVKEIHAPEGYVLSDKELVIQMSDFDKRGYYEFSYENKRIDKVPTGVLGRSSTTQIMMLISISTVIGFIVSKRKRSVRT